MHHHGVDLANFLKRRKDEPVVLWYAASSGDPRDVPRARIDFTLVQALRHLKSSHDIYAFDIDMARGDKMRLGQKTVNALIDLEGQMASDDIVEGDIVQPESGGRE